MSIYAPLKAVAILILKLPWHKHTYYPVQLLFTSVVTFALQLQVGDGTAVCGRNDARGVTVIREKSEHKLPHCVTVHTATVFHLEGTCHSRVSV